MEVSAAASRSVSNQAVAIENLKVIVQLAARDRKVRAHEQAHLAAAGAYSTTGRRTRFRLDRTARAMRWEARWGSRTIEAVANAPADVLFVGILAAPKLKL